MKNKKHISILVFALAALAGCSASVTSPQSGGTPPPAIGSGPVSGTIQGQAWAMLNGEAHPNQGASGNLILIDLWPNSSRTPCSTGDPTSVTATQVYAYVKPAGATTINIFASDGTSFSFNYMAGSTSTIDVASQGTVTLTSVTSSQVVGNLTASAADGNAVSGQFAVTLCPF